MFKFSKLRIAIAAFAWVKNFEITLVSCQPNDFEFPQVSNDDEELMQFNEGERAAAIRETNSRLHLKRYPFRRIEEYDNEILRWLDDVENGQMSHNKQSYGFDEPGFEDEIERLIHGVENGQISKANFNRQAESYGRSLPAPPPTEEARQKMRLRYLSRRLKEFYRLRRLKEMPPPPPPGKFIRLSQPHYCPQLPYKITEKQKSSLSLMVVTARMPSYLSSI